MVLLDCIYINNSGGKVLLDYLISRLHQEKADVLYLIDERCKGDYPYLNTAHTIYLRASFKERYRFYKTNKARFSKVVCMGNIPPPLRLKVPVYTYFHNVLFFEQPKTYPLKDTLLKKLKGIFIRFFRGNSDFFIVQSGNVKDLLVKNLGIKESECMIIPFYNDAKANKTSAVKKDEFVFISNGNPHKNHVTLLKAWEILSKRGVNLILNLTVTETYPDILSLIQTYQAKGLHIHNLGYTEVSKLYGQCKFAIYPSLAESFGLGLIEAVESGCEIIAADLAYVHAVVEPLTVFDPHSPESIADAVIKGLERSKQGPVSRAKISNKIGELVSLIKE